MLNNTEDQPSQSCAQLQAALPVKDCRFTLKIKDQLNFKDYSGSAWRGALGHQLKASSCITSHKNCTQCALKSRCSYAMLYETAPPKHSLRMRKYTQIPHPMVLKPVSLKTHYTAGENLYLHLVLIGNSQAQLERIQDNLIKVGHQGLHQGKGHYLLTDVQQIEVQTLPPLPDDDLITIDFQTPTRIKYQKKLMTNADFSFAGFFTNLLRRYSSLSYFYSQTPLDLDFKTLVAEANQVRLRNSRLDWHQWNRYSNRQKQSIPMDGLIGNIQLRSTDLKPFWPLLWHGQSINVGKSTTMGLGAYHITTRSKGNQRSIHS